ncbi:hypothetical protein C488_10508 [Natrinema pellirubrum DSM 15624]|uniref:Uncharacterized protein n=1 Tax=Natrinema pellirubrum (strain DSM 15624 / CIP 106293 / JCM 10476 / NCIMB 786 / 157) TaxID=797303 RepID=L9YN19_NATP1|nr:hypothetical protein C488_10508 [Natrinema pellirubrum DSM 15624]
MVGIVSLLFGTVFLFGSRSDSRCGTRGEPPIDRTDASMSRPAIGRSNPAIRPKEAGIYAGSGDGAVRWPLEREGSRVARSIRRGE